MLCLYQSHVQAQGRAFGFPAQTQHKPEASHSPQIGDLTGQRQPPAASRRSLGRCPSDHPRRKWPCRTQLRTCRSQRGDSGPTTTKGKNKPWRIPQCGYWASLFLQRSCLWCVEQHHVTSNSWLQKGLGKAKPIQNGRGNKANHPHWTASQYFQPTRKAMGFFIQGFKGPGSLWTLENTSVSASAQDCSSTGPTLTTEGIWSKFHAANRSLVALKYSRLPSSLVLQYSPQIHTLARIKPISASLRLIQFPFFSLSDTTKRTAVPWLGPSWVFRGH